MKIYVAIDDTDSIDEGSTGESANGIISHIENSNWGKCHGLTRHQLLIHSDIPYTSHNSSMCFTADIEAECLDLLIRDAGDMLRTGSAPGSDPGLCIAPEERIKDASRIMDFGRRAKKEIVTKEEAYALAGDMSVHLSEHGGTGIGVIGALAGVGLRMTKNDGRFQGKLKLKIDEAPVEEIMRLAPVEIVMTKDGYVLRSNEMVRPGDNLKTVLLDGRRTLLVCRCENSAGWDACTKDQLKEY
jgi:hypothetical protein